jgi:hypothetical protein
MNDSSEDPDRTRLQAAAMAMLADGNSVEAVADLCNVPVDVVAAWARRELAPAAAPAEARPVRPWTPVHVRVWSLSFAVCIAMMLYGVFLIGKIVVSDAWNGRNGSPPIEQLERTEGVVQGWYDCREGRGGYPSRVTLQTAAGTRVMNLPCHLPVALFGRTPHRMTVLRWQREDRAVVYDVELDGAKLLAYADVRLREDDGHRLRIGLACLLAWVAFFAFAAWMDWTLRKARATGRVGMRGGGDAR